MLRVVSFFSGIGGADFGAVAAGRRLGVDVRIVAAYDKWPVAVDRYNANRPPEERVARVADIKTLQPGDLPPHDLVIGGPPCQSFSVAGAKTGFDDPRNCVPDFIRLTRGGRTPFVMENVVGGLLRYYGVAAYEACLRAEDFGDASTRARHFYTNLAPIIERDHVATLFSDGMDIYAEKAFPRTFGDIRDFEADEAFRTKRGVPLGDVEVAFRNGIDTGRIMRPQDRFGSLTSHSNDNIDRKALAAFERDLSAERGKPVVVRHPSLREMARAQSIPDSFDWGERLPQRDLALMIANAWPFGMAASLMGGVLDVASRMDLARVLEIDRNRPALRDRDDDRYSAA